MKRLVVNKYKKVLMVMGNTLQTMTTIGVYANVREALEGMSRLFNDVLFQEKPERVDIYGIIIEDNGYEHSANVPIFTTDTRQFWGGKKPDITEIQRY